MVGAGLWHFWRLRRRCGDSKEKGALGGSVGEWVGGGALFKG